MFIFLIFFFLPPSPAKRIRLQRAHSRGAWTRRASWTYGVVVDLGWGCSFFSSSHFQKHNEKTTANSKIHSQQGKITAKSKIPLPTPHTHLQLLQAALFHITHRQRHFQALKRSQNLAHLRVGRRTLVAHAIKNTIHKLAREQEPQRQLTGSEGLGRLRFSFIFVRNGLTFFSHPASAMLSKMGCAA